MNKIAPLFVSLLMACSCVTEKSAPEKSFEVRKAEFILTNLEDSCQRLHLGYEKNFNNLDCKVYQNGAQPEMQLNIRSAEDQSDAMVAFYTIQTFCHVHRILSHPDGYFFVSVGGELREQNSCKVVLDQVENGTPTP